MAGIRDFFNRIFRRGKNQNSLPEHATFTREIVEGIIARGPNAIREVLENSRGIDHFYSEIEKMDSENYLYRNIGAHDVEHIERVVYLANTLAVLDGFTDSERKMLLAAARYHDIGRVNDRVDSIHGQEALRIIDEENLLKDFSDKEQKIIKFAIEGHSKSREENAVDVNNLPKKEMENYVKILTYLKDADALDRVRIANKDMKLDPSRLRTRTAANLIKFAEDTYRYFNFNIKSEYKINQFADELPDLRNAYNLVKDSITPDWVIENKEFLVDIYKRGVINNLRKENEYFLDFIEDGGVVVAGSTEIMPGDFEYILDAGYNINYKSFLEIIGHFKEGTLDILRKENRLQDIFKKSTFEQYGKEQNLDERLNSINISDEELLEKINANASTIIAKSTFEDDYMIYKNMYENHPRAFEILEYTAPDYNFKSIAGIIERVNPKDVEKLYQKFNFRISLKDLIIMASRFSGSEYRELMDGDAMETLLEYDPDRDNPYYYERVMKSLRKAYPGNDDEIFYDNYKLYEAVLAYRPDIYDIPEMKNYHISEIFAAYSKVNDAEDKLANDGKRVSYSPRTILNVLEFSRKTRILDLDNENEKNEVISLLIEDETLKDDPRLIEYVTKRNKVYPIKNVQNLYNYNKFCMEEILLDRDISLEDAKRNLVNSLFVIDAPITSEYREELEENIIDELYFYKKYKDTGLIESGNPKTEAEKELEIVIDTLIKIMDTNNIDDFKRELFDSYKDISQYNYDSIRDLTNVALREISKSDIKTELSKTEDMLNQTSNGIIEYGEEEIPVKILDGQEFSLAITTVMPNCSSVSKKTLSGDKDAVKNNMLNRPLNPNNRCTTLINQDMIAHPMPFLEDEELLYAYVPNDEKSISLVGKHDLSTVKRDINGKTNRVTFRSVQNRTCKDTIGTINEEHGEAVLNNVYPRYIVCFDKITEVAIQKYKMLKEQYEKDGIDQNIEILFIEGKDKYLPRMEDKLSQSFATINREIDETGSLSQGTLDTLINKRENNILIQTIQTINSYGYRNELWQGNSGAQRMQELIKTLGRVAEVVPREYANDVWTQLDFLERKSDRNDERFGNRIYDHSYNHTIYAPTVVEIKKKLEDRFSYDKDEMTIEEIPETERVEEQTEQGFYE